MNEYMHEDVYENMEDKVGNERSTCQPMVNCCFVSEIYFTYLILHNGKYYIQWVDIIVHCLRFF
jgi:hypothetical protein